MNLENQNEIDCLFFEEQPLPFGSWDQHFAYSDGGFNLGPASDFFEFEPFLLGNPINQSTHVELSDFDDIYGDLSLWDFNPPLSFHDDNHAMNPNSIGIVVANDQIINIQDENTMYDSSLTTTAANHQEIVSFNGDITDLKRYRKYKSSALELEEIQKYFDVPITKAAKELNVGLTVLKKRCRELNIMRWPHRKIKSLKSLIHNVKELGLSNEIGMLEEHKRMVERVPEMELTERTKKLRQACFKANYKKRRSLQQSTSLP